MVVQTPENITAHLDIVRPKLFPSFESSRVNSLHNLDFLTSAAQLGPISNEKVSSLRLNFKSTSFTWETYEDADGTQKSRLVTT